MRRSIAILTLLAAAGCGERGPVGEDRGVSANQIERLSTPQVENPDPQAAARPQPLRRADLDLAGLVAPACAFGRDGRMLLAVSPGDAIARVAGTLHHLALSSPAGPTGGFFEDRQISISVGRIGEVPPGEGAAGRWPGRITVTNRRAEAQVELDGVWQCGI
ncbi:MAG TPA: hypothetical protein VGW40_16010 [Allosphingosinicella sp.]|nr:hypothetical protein [Allosphingosinicella sp.]